MRIARDAHTPDLTLGEVGDLLFTAIEVFIGHAFGRPMVISELSRNLEMPRDAVRRKLQRLLEIGLVERIDHHYYMTAKANTPLQREVLLAHLRNMQSAITEVTKMDPPAFNVDPYAPPSVLALLSPWCPNVVDRDDASPHSHTLTVPVLGRDVLVEKLRCSAELIFPCADARLTEPRVESSPISSDV